MLSEGMGGEASWRRLRLDLLDLLAYTHAAGLSGFQLMCNLKTSIWLLDMSEVACREC